MRAKNRKASINTVLWIAFYVLLGLVLLWILNKAGVFQSQTFAKLKETIFPFG